MVTLTATEVRNNIGMLWSAASNGSVMILRAGQAIAVVMSPAEFEKLTARRRGAKAGFAKHLFRGVDLNALPETSLDDVFEDYR